MSPYIISYMHKYVDAGIGYSHSIWLSAGALAMFGVSMPLSGLFWRKIGLRKVVFFACFLNRYVHSTDKNTLFLRSYAH